MGKHEDFEKRMAETYPLLYADMYGDIKATPMAFGLDIGPGWFSLIEELSTKLEPLIQECKDLDPEFYPKAAQVKEKFGGLRFYMTTETEEMSKLIRKAEAKSFKTCEECGEPGEVRGLGWVRTLCDMCYVDAIPSAKGKGW